MAQQYETRNVNKIKAREDLYPRIDKDPALVQEYAENIEKLPPIEIHQDNFLIDGWHRLTAFKKKNQQDISVIVTKTKNDTEFLTLAIKRNATHGKQLNLKEYKDCWFVPLRLYKMGKEYVCSIDVLRKVKPKKKNGQKHKKSLRRN